MNNQKEIHVHFDQECANNLFDNVARMIESGMTIHTNNAYFAKTKYIVERGYRVFIHPAFGDVFEITLGECSHTNREIRVAHNIPHMLLTGVFDDTKTVITYYSHI